MFIPAPRFYLTIPWYVITPVVLAAGLLCVLVGLRWLYFPAPSSFTPAPFQWQLTDLSPLQGRATVTPTKLQVQCDQRGRAIINLPVTSLQVNHYNFIVLHGQQLQQLTGAFLLWQTLTPPDPLLINATPTASPIHETPLPLTGWSAVWLSLHSLPDWNVNVARLAIGVQGAPNSVITVTRIELLPATLPNVFRAIVANWAHYTPWTLSSINTQPAATTLSAPQLRLPIVISWLFCSAGLYGIFLLLHRRVMGTGCAPERRVFISFVIIGWVALDAPWAWQLQRQHADTRATFAEYSFQQRPYHTDDGWLYALLMQLKTPLATPARDHSPPPRVFIASGDDYFGMRAAYHLLPLRVLWQRGATSLPAASFMRRGDVIVSLVASAVNYHAPTQQLRWIAAAQPQQLTVTPLLMDERVSAWRVNE